MISAQSASVLEIAGVCLWIGASLGGFGLLALGGGGRRGLLAFLKAQLAIQSIAAVILGGVLLVPVVMGGQAPVDPDAALKVEFPSHDDSFWRGLVVLHGGRKKPFDTAADETFRQIHGRSKFQKHDAATVVLQWLMLNGHGIGGRQDVWEKEPFILCPDGDLRELIYRDLLGPDVKLTDEHRRGKFIAPEELRKSAAFLRLFMSAQEKRMEDKDKAQQNFTPAERKANEVLQRLHLFDQTSQGDPTSFGQYRNREKPEDPIGFVALDQRGGGWFTMGQLREFKAEEARAREAIEKKLAEPLGFSLSGLAIDQAVTDLVAKAALGAVMVERVHKTSTWRRVMRDRLSRLPQLYLSPERMQSLAEFQEQIKAGTAKQSIDVLAQELEGRQKNVVQENLAAFQAGDDEVVILFVINADLGADECLQLLRAKEFAQMIAPGEQRRLAIYLQYLLNFTRSEAEKKRLTTALLAVYQRPNDLKPLATELADILAQRDQKVIDDLQRRVQSARREYHPEDERFRMLHLNYLENRFPNIYIESAAWQPYPREDVDRVLAAFEGVQAAYKSSDSDLFAVASQQFFDTIREVSEKYDTVNGYPGVTTAALEIQFNRVRPFMWGWIAMLGCIAILVASITAHRFEFPLAHKILYGLGWLMYCVSLGFQAYGFYARIAIAGRPPVSNMYETIIFVAAMSALFAVLLEIKYRRTVILLGGAVAACLALVLADQLPNVQGLESDIRPLVPVLRSNYWLTIHVLTIVASYAGGALAWVIGNFALGMMAFGNPRRDTLKTMSQFSYRGMQIAVLLLAAGTFLGGWWAAESWGRFWGWDPKEVWALISLVCYVIPLHARYAGWVKDFGLAVSAVLCFAAIMFSWYGVNFVLGAGLHSYGFGGGGPWWVAWAALLDLVFVLICCLKYQARIAPAPSSPAEHERPVEALV